MVTAGLLKSFPLCGIEESGSAPLWRSRMRSGPGPQDDPAQGPSAGSDQVAIRALYFAALGRGGHRTRTSCDASPRRCVFDASGNPQAPMSSKAIQKLSGRVSSNQE
jgi:hypothetical protein